MMNTDQPITKEYFIKRLIDLCLRSGLSGYPTDLIDQHILYKSAALSLDFSGAVTEKEVNEQLKNWITNITRMKGIDHLTLRRALVDAGYLSRNNDGTCYQVSSRTRPPFFDASVDQVNVAEVIQTGRDEIARRKRAYLEKQKA